MAMEPVTIGIIVFAAVLVTIAVLFYKFHIKKKDEGEISATKTVYYTDEYEGLDRVRVENGLEYIDSENKKIRIPYSKDNKRDMIIVYADEIECFDVIENMRSKEEHYVRRRHAKRTKRTTDEEYKAKEELKKARRQIRELGRKNIILEREIYSNKTTHKRDIKDFVEGIKGTEQNKGDK